MTKDNTISPIDFPGRIAALAASLRKEGVAAYIGTRQASLHYLVGAFMPWRGAVIVTADGSSETIYWAMDCSRVREEGMLGNLTEFSFDGMTEAIHDALVRLKANAGRVGLDLSHPGAAQVAPGMLTAAEYLDLHEKLPGAKLENGVRLIDDLMLIKSLAEIARLREAARVSDIGFRAGLAAVHEGVTENHIAGVIEQAIRDHGSTWAWSVTGGTEVGSGPRTGFFHGVTQQATDRRIGRNEFVIIDLHAMIDLYFADTAIPVFLGKPDEQQAKMIDCWEDVAATMLASLKPGRAVTDCVKDGIATFERYGMKDYGLPFFGHGLGTCARTRPFLTPRSDDVVEPGMVVALGTHLYVPQHGGLRLEYPTLITENGAEPLVETPPRVQLLG